MIKALSSIFLLTLSLNTYAANNIDVEITNQETKTITLEVTNTGLNFEDLDLVRAGNSIIITSINKERHNKSIYASKQNAINICKSLALSFSDYDYFNTKYGKRDLLNINSRGESIGFVQSRSILDKVYCSEK